MFHKFFISIALVLTVCMLSTITSAVQVNPMEKSHWTCFDYSMDYHDNNPDTGMVTISDNPLFYGKSHMVNYRLKDNSTWLLIHDGLLHADYVFPDWEHSGKYFHFWTKDETPVRRYRFLRDNRNVIISQQEYLQKPRH